MTPQPLSSYRAIKRFTVFTSVTRSVDTLPEHAALVAKIIGEAASLDFFQATTLIALLGADAEPSFAMFDAIHQTAKNAALRAAARKVLPKAEQEVFDALISFIKAVDKHRNRIAHGIWITCKELPDGFIVVDHDEYFRYMIENGKQLAKIYPRRVSVGAEYDFDYRKIFNYSKANLTDIVEEYRTLRDWLATFKVHIHPHIDEQPHGRRYDQLIREPRLQRALARMRGAASEPDL